MGGTPEVGGPEHLHTLHIPKATTEEELFQYCTQCCRRRCSPPTYHYISYFRGLRLRRNSGETQRLDRNQGLSQSSEVNDI